MDAVRSAELEDLIVETAAGDRAAFASLYDQTSSRVFGLVRRILVDTAQSEEVTQEVFLEIWQTAGRFERTRGRAVSWILTVAHRRAIDRVRSSQASRDRDRRSGLRDWEAPHDPVAERAETVVESARVRVALARLTPLQRQAIELAYFEGRTSAELATLLQVPVGTAKTRLREGLVRLRELLADGQVAFS